MEVKPFTPIGITGKQSRENEAVNDDPEYLKAFDEWSETQDKYDRLEKLLTSPRKDRLGGFPKTTQEARSSVEPRYATLKKIAHWGFIGTGIVAGFMAPNFIVSLAIGIATFAGVSKGIPGKIVEKCFIEGKVDKIVKADIEEQKGKAAIELEASKTRLKEAEAAALKRKAAEPLTHDAVIEHDDAHVSIGGFKLDKSS